MRFETLEADRKLTTQERARAVDIILKDPEHRPDPAQFKGILYTAEAIAKDIETTARIRGEFKERDRKDPEAEKGRRFSAAFERVFREWAPRLGWIGQGAEIVPTSEFDDYENGVDGVLILRGPEYLALAIDATHQRGSDRVEKKMRRAIGHVTGKDNPAVVKYFQYKNIRGRLDDIIPVVVGLDEQDADRLVNIFGKIFTLIKQKDRSEGQEETLRKKIRELRSHPAQKVFLQEIQVQLQMYQRLLNLPENTKANVKKEQVDTILGIIEGTLEEKSGVELGDLEYDGVLKTIRTFSESQG